jgi:chromosome segregation ATPase
MKSFLFVGLVLVLLGVVNPVSAQEKSIRDLVFPPVTSGPGYILPDSPFYGIDKAYQRIRLALIFTADNRASLHNQIAGERLAELRVMTARDDQAGIDKALSELSWELHAAVTELHDARAQGKDIKELATAINQSIAQKREVLVAVSQQLPGTAFEQKLLAASESLKEEKSAAEEVLPDADREYELAVSTEEELENAVMGVSASALKLEKKLELFEEQASKAAEKRANLEEEKTANSRELLRVEQQLAKLKLERQRRLDEMRQTLRQTQEAAQKLRDARKAEAEYLKETNSSASAGI